MTFTATSSLVGYQPPRAGWQDALTAHGAANVAQIIAAYTARAAVYDLDANLALAQACQECAWFTDWKWTDRFNPCGLGVTSRAEPGPLFASIEQGIEAHLQHLCDHAYLLATCPVETRGLPIVDPRHAFHKGQPALGDLETPPFKWAVPGDGYITAICAIANSVGGAPVGTLMDGLGVKDIRDQLETNPNGGPATRAAKHGVVIHYNGPAVNRPGRDQLTIDASYHVHKDWSSDGSGAYGDGIMYHYAVDENGALYLLRDPDAVLWHCGYWGTPGNADGTAIQVTIGEGQNATAPQLAALTRLVDALRQRDSFGAEMVKGHQEVNPTSCPGSLMADFVYPYRTGTIGGGTVATGFKDDVTGHLVANAMYDFFAANGGITTIGRPVTDEVQDEWPDDPKGSPKRTVQYFERDVLGFFPENTGAARVQALRLGAKLAKERGYSGPGIP